MGDVAELSESAARQVEQLNVAHLLTERILTIGRSLVGSNHYLDVITYRLPNHEQPHDYIAELIEHTGPREAITILHARYGNRNSALWLLLDRAERELNITMSQCRIENGVHIINTHRLGRPPF